MARETRRERGTRGRVGMCINEECELCKSKAKQTIRPGHDFVCESCGSELRECKVADNQNKWVKIGVGAAVGVVAVAGLSWALLSGGSDKPQEKTVDATAQVDKGTDKSAKISQKNMDSMNVAKPAPEVKQNVEQPTGAVDLGYAYFNGKMVNGLMNDDNGVLTFKETHIIEPRDVKKRTAKAGEKVIGIFEDGHLVTGKWYKSDGNQEMIIP